MKLSDTQLVVLNSTCQRADRRVLPLPTNLKGGAAEKVIASHRNEKAHKGIQQALEHMALGKV
jgi:hypothetical protein